MGTLIFGILFLAINWDSIIAPTETNFMKPFDTFYEVLAIGMVYYLLKDIYKGRSFGKRLLGIGVRDLDNDSVTPGAFRLLVRNVTIILWPIEIFLLVVSQRRLGDIIAKTNVKKL
ncbi:hypothetical protein DQG23_14605 [Paenibacillus contaminans]|uniref:RDD domain-containing protein n=1 Tax=Paenibacillus contaminans TaxID=450362 RepID=A0A329MPS4_9BACL|nr:hypothetical protein DQG23_14605 [Paenibacillus contaminans]